MISHGPKHGSRHQNQFSRRLRTKVTVSLHEVVLGLLQPLHPVLDLQVGLRLLKMAPNDFPWPKTLVQKPKSILQKAQNNFEILGLVFQTTHFRRSKWRSKHGKMQKIKALSFLQFFLKFHKMGSFLHGKQHLGVKNQFCLTT